MRVITVASCQQCPFLFHLPIDHADLCACTHPNGEPAYYASIDTIPNWCPLPKAKEGK